MESFRMNMKKHSEYSVGDRQVHPRTVLEVEMLELLEENFGESMISPDYFEKFINETLDIQLLVQVVNFYNKNAEEGVNKVLELKEFDTNEDVGKLA